MRTIQDITNFQAFLPSFEDGDTVSGVYRNGKIIEIKEVNHKHVSCPMCGSQRGYRVSNASKHNHKFFWSCAEDRCIVKNCYKTN